MPWLHMCKCIRNISYIKWCEMYALCDLNIPFSILPSIGASVAFSRTLLSTCLVYYALPNKYDNNIYFHYLLDERESVST